MILCFVCPYLHLGLQRHNHTIAVLDVHIEPAKVRHLPLKMSMLSSVSEKLRRLVVPTHHVALHLSSIPVDFGKTKFLLRFRAQLGLLFYCHGESSRYNRCWLQHPKPCCTSLYSAESMRMRNDIDLVWQPVEMVEAEKPFGMVSHYHV